ncbi:MAG: hypothetical protein ACYC61_27650 [Isosphaeraceae bacterium]
MRRYVTIAAGLVLGLSLTAADASAQGWYYPGSYGNYGMAGWGGDPAAAYMTGLGSYARGRGVYLIDRAKARSIEIDNTIKWNKAVRARQRVLRQDQKEADAEAEARRDEKLAARHLESGATLNALLDQIYDVDPGVSKVSAAKAPLSPAAIREIPFEWNSEALTACIDQMTATGSAIPTLLMDDRYVDERNALRAAVEPALKEDARGNVSLETRHKIHEAVANLRAKFIKNTGEFDPGYKEAINYLHTLASLNRMLNDPSMQKFLGELDDGKERTVGDLITFMNAYNLRFGRATSDHQLEIYRRLVALLSAIRDELNPSRTPPTSLDKSGQGLQSAAKDVFRGMNWNDIEAHAAKPPQ